MKQRKINQHQPQRQHQASFFKRHQKTLLFTLLYVAVFLAASFIYYRRFPNNYREPNFYAEDGRVFARNIIEKGFWEGLFTTFNGYYIWAVYLLHQISMVVNRLFFGNEFVNLPRSIALVSYAFFGFIATMPLLLFRNYFKPAVIGLMTLLIIFVPMVESDYAIIGTIGNLKFAFIFVAFLLLVYRHLAPKGSRLIYLTDFALLICAYTNVTVYAMLLFAALRYWPEIKNRQFAKLFKDRSFQSLAVLGVLLLPQLYIVKKYGIPPLPGYLDNPFNSKRAIEIFVARSYIYSLLFSINKHLNDAWAVLLTLLAFGLGLFFSGKYRKVFLFGIFSIFVATFLFVIKRTGISDFYFGYKSGGPDQFFFPQNWIFGFIAALALGEAVGRFKKLRYERAVYAVAFLLLLTVFVPRAGNYGKNDFMEKNIGNIYAQSQAKCKTNQKDLELTIYPAAYLKYEHATRQQLCTHAALNYNPPVVKLGLKPFGNKYLAELGVINKVSQTFVSPRNRLAGVRVFFSTFKRTTRSPYSFTLYDKTCQHSLAKVALKPPKIKDNDFYDIRFPAIADSQNKTYCFSVASDKPAAPDPLAIQQSAPDSYLAGDTKVNGQPVTEDLVFELLYK